tara:strand:- start:6 stop:1214 length:1209 start_codon:yes stop_codon:yes gene_type:complete
MQEGGVPRQGYFLGKLVRKIKDDIIPNELKNPLGLAAAATLAADQFGIPGTDIGGNKKITGTIADILFGKPTQEGERGITREGGLFGGIKKAGSAAAEAIMKPRFPNPNQKNTEPQSIGDRLLSGIFGGPGLALASGLLAGAFTKDKEDPIYTGQDVGLNLQDIAKLANISDPKTASAIGLRFSPDVEARKFTPAEMAETYAANQPVDFTEKREQAQDGGMMGDQKDFEEFLQDMQNRDNQMLQDRIMRDFEEFMKRKRMIDQMPEAKDGGIMKMKDGGLTKYEISSLKGLGYDTKGGTVLEPFGGLKVLRDILKVNKMAEGGIASMADDGMMDMGGMEMDLRGGGFVPMGRAEKADDVPARLSKNEFVFTADAVRAAGGGDVDKGADKMYATMKKLEDRVA